MECCKQEIYPTNMTKFIVKSRDVKEKFIDETNIE